MEWREQGNAWSGNLVAITNGCYLEVGRQLLVWHPTYNYEGSRAKATNSVGTQRLVWNEGQRDAGCGCCCAYRLPLIRFQIRLQTHRMARLVALEAFRGHGTLLTMEVRESLPTVWNGANRVMLGQAMLLRQQEVGRRLLDWIPVQLTRLACELQTALEHRPLGLEQDRRRRKRLLLCLHHPLTPFQIRLQTCTEWSSLW